MTERQPPPSPPHLALVPGWHPTGGPPEIGGAVEETTLGIYGCLGSGEPEGC